MSLNWNIEKIADYESVCFIETEEGKRLAPLTEALIFLTVGVGLGEITKANASEFYTRVTTLDKLGGPMLTGRGGKPHAITLEEIEAHIGLYTNVANKSRPKWLRENVGSTVDDIKRAAERERKRAAVA